MKEYDKLPHSRRFEKARIDGKKIEVLWGTKVLVVDNETKQKLTSCSQPPRYIRRLQNRLQLLALVDCPPAKRPVRKHIIE